MGHALPDDSKQFDKLEGTITSMFEKLDRKVDDCNAQLANLDKQVAVMIAHAEARDSRIENHEERIGAIEKWKGEMDRDNVRRNTLLIGGGGGLGAAVAWLTDLFRNGPPASP